MTYGAQNAPAKGTSPGWAIVTLLLGVALAFPFFRKSRSDSAEHAKLLEQAKRLPTDESSPVGLGHSLADRLRRVSGMLPTTQVEKQTGALAAGQISGDADAPRADLADLNQAIASLSHSEGNRQRQTPQPEWAQPASPLDELLNHGPDVSAVAPNALSMEALPRWVPEQLTGERTSNESSTSASADADSQDAFAFRASPWENDDRRQSDFGTGDAASISSLVAESTSRPVWPDELGPVPLPQSAPLNDVARYMSRDGPGNLASISAKGNVGDPESSVDRNGKDSRNVHPSLKQPFAEHRRRRFVYQPGFQPDE